MTVHTRTIVFMRELSTTAYEEHAPRVEVYKNEDGDYELAFQYLNKAVIASREDACRVANTIAELIEEEI